MIKKTIILKLYSTADIYKPLFCHVIISKTKDQVTCQSNFQNPEEKLMSLSAKFISGEFRTSLPRVFD